MGQIFCIILYIPVGKPTLYLSLSNWKTKLGTHFEPWYLEPRYSEILTEYYTTEPDAPKDLRVTKWDQMATLSWKNPDAPVKDYIVILDTIPIDESQRKEFNNIMAQWDEGKVKKINSEYLRGILS